MKNDLLKKTLGKFPGFIIIFIIDLFCIIGLIVLMRDITSKSSEIKVIKTTIARGNDVNIKIIENDLKNSQEKYSKLQLLFPDESGLVNFVMFVDSLKKQGIVDSFSLASNEIVKDKTGYFGLPVIIESQGNKDKINSVVEKVYTSSYMIRTINFEVRKIGEENNEKKYSLKIGGFLYVDDKFKKN